MGMKCGRLLKRLSTLLGALILVICEPSAATLCESLSEGMQAQALTAVFFAEGDSSLGLADAEVAFRVAKVAEMEKARRSARGARPLGGPDGLVVARDAAQIRNLIRQRRYSLEDFRSQMGGPIVFAGSNVVMPVPNQARYNHEMLVYEFEGRNLVRTIPFSEYAIQKMPDQIKLYRMVANANPAMAEVRELESRGWRTKSEADLIQSVELYKTTLGASPSSLAFSQPLKDSSFHFSVDGFWGGTPKSDYTLVEIKIPKNVLLQMARQGEVVVGNTALTSITEVLVYRQGLAKLLKYLTAVQ